VVFELLIDGYKKEGGLFNKVVSVWLIIEHYGFYFNLLAKTEEKKNRIDSKREEDVVLIIWLLFQLNYYLYEVNIIILILV